MSIAVYPSVNAELNVKRENTFNSNGNDGVSTNRIFPPSNLKINVESDATLESCKNGRYDIGGIVFEDAEVDFSGDGYTCEQAKVVFTGTGADNVDKPVCKRCT